MPYFLFFFFTVLVSSQVTYKFSQNFDQTFTDLSGSGNHGQNGLSTLTSTSDTISTTRGAYFPEGSNAHIKLPPNEVKTTSLTLGSSFTLVMWMNSLDNNDYFLSYRKSEASGDYFYLKKKDNGNYLMTRLVQGSYDSSLLTSPSGELLKNGKKKVGTWVYVVMINQGTITTFHANNIVALTLNLPSSYSEVGSYLHFIGFTSESFEGFVWSFYLFNEYRPVSDFYSASYSGSNCLVKKCPESCSPAIKEENIEYCISVALNKCGCIDGQCLYTASCLSGYCKVYLNSLKCYCTSSAFCKSGEFCSSSKNICLPCHTDCAECESELLCTKCFATNATPHNTVGCICKTGFYNTTALNNSASCLTCYAECSTCSGAFLCDSCRDSNSMTHNSIGCACKVGFYNNTALINGGSCLSCYAECSTCSSSLICGTCRDSNSMVHNSIGCVCKEGFYNVSALIKGGSCLSCYAECSACSGAFLCSSCRDSNSMTHNSIGCICKEGFYNVSALINGGSCLSCYAECSTCSGAFLCKSCKKSNSMIHNNIGCVCEDRFYNVSALINGGSCLPCYAECSKCSSSLLCDSCLDSNSTIHPSLGCICKAGFYNTSALFQGGSCLSCESNCLKCPEYCIDCPYQNSYLSTTNECLCSPKFYSEIPLKSGGKCSNCHPDCKTCNEPLKCLTCEDENAEIHLNVGCFCKFGFFNSTSLFKNGSCMPCLEGCKSCLSLEVCTECFDSTSSLIKRADCVFCSGFNFNDDLCTCKAGFYIDLENPGECKTCSNGCKTCVNSSICLECNDRNAYLSENFHCLCRDGYWKAEKNLKFACFPCNNRCKTCKSSDFCLSCSDPKEDLDVSGHCKCKENFIEIKNHCICPEGFKEENSHCVDYFFYMNLMINKENRIHVNFSEIPQNLSSQDFEISIKSQDFSSKVHKAKVNSFYIQVTSDQQINAGTFCQVSIIKEEVFSEKGAKLKEYSQKVELFEELKVNPQLKALVGKMKTTSQATVAASIGIAMVSNPAAAWSLINTLQLINFIPLSNDPLTLTIRKLVLASGGFNMIPNVMLYVFSENLSTQPFSGSLNNQIERSVYCINAGQVIVMLVGLLVFFPILKLFSKIPVEALSKRCQSTYTNNKYSAFLRLWIQSYLDLIVFSFIQLLSKNKENPGAFRFNLFLAGMTIFLAAFSIPASLILILTHHKNIEGNDQNLFIKYGSLYSELDTKKGKFSLIYYHFYFLRRMLYVLNQIFLTSIPNVQRISNIFLSFLSFVYILIARPFKSLDLFFVNLASEICILVIFVCVYVLSVESTSEALIEMAVTYTLLGFIGIQILISVVVFVVKMVYIVRKARKNNETRISYVID